MAVRTVADRTFWSTRLPPDPASVPQARHFALDAADNLGALGNAEELALLTSEVATNAVVHARTPMRLSVWRCEGRLRVEVRDDDPTPPREVDPDPLVPGGRGVKLVQLLAAAWGVNGNERGKTVWFELDP